MRFLDEPLFQAIFQSATPRLVVLPDAPQFSIAASNTAFNQLVAMLGDGAAPWKNLSSFCAWMWNDEAHCRNVTTAVLQALQSGQRTSVYPPGNLAPATEFSTRFTIAEIDVAAAQSNEYSYVLISFINAETNRMQRSIEEGLQRENALGEALATSRTDFSNQTAQLQQSEKDLSELNTDLENRVLLRTQILALSEARFRRMVQEAPIAIGILRGRSLVIETANSQLLNLWGKTSEVLLKPLAEALPELQGQPFLQLIDDVYTSGQPYYGSALPAQLMHDGKLRNGYFNFVYYPLAEDDGETRIMLVANDVTPQVEAAQRIALSQRRLQSVVNTAPLGITVLRGTELVIELANEPMLAIWGRSREQVMGNKILEVFPELLDQPFPKLLENVFRSGNRLEIAEIAVNIVTNEGKVQRYLDFSYDPLFDEEGKVEAVLAIVKDITEQVEYRKAIEHAEEMSRLAIEASEMGDWHIDLATKKFTASPRLKELYGFAAHEEMLLEDAVGQVAEQHRERVRQAVESTLNEGTLYDEEFPLVVRNQDKVRWVKAIGKLFMEAGGKATYFAGVKMDITEQRENEQRKNDFIGMVSHELKTPLTSLKGYVQILQQRAQQEKDIFRITTLDKVNRQVARMQRMINGFLSIAALESGKLQLNREKFNLIEVVKEALEDAILNHPKITFRLKDHVKMPVEVDRDKISQVLLNLLSNAVKYAPQGRYIDVVCREVEGQAIISVQDQGIGISKENLDKLFDRFYRVESEQMKNIAGFGIGLYLCYEIITRHGGHIWAESELGQGTTFYFNLPLVDQ